MNGESYLLSLPGFMQKGIAAFKPGLERINRLLVAMGMPHQKYPTIHIAGTNGKGSTASFISAIITASGKRVGLHTSPHLFHVTERMKIDGVSASAHWLDSRTARYKALFEDIGVSFFEATLALSFQFFAEEEVDVAVIETGLGGRLDATNVLSPNLCVITSVGYDHMNILGNTLGEIAREKAGIIKPDTPVISAVTSEEAKTVIGEVARTKGAPFFDVFKEVHWSVSPSMDDTLVSFATPIQKYEALQIGLHGVHQYVNVASALRAIEIFFPKESLNVKDVNRGVSHVSSLAGIRGRLEVYRKEPLIVLDVSHNCDSLGAGLQFMKEALHSRSGQLYVAFGTMRDKEIEKMARMLADNDAYVFVLPVPSERALLPGDMLRLMTSAKVPAQIVHDIDDLLELFYQRSHHRDGLLITGSHLVISQFPDIFTT